MGQTKVFELAEIGERAIAIFIDSVIVGIIGGAIGIGGGNPLWGGGVLSFLLGAGYQWYFLTQQTGQTPGKMLMNIRVIKVDGTPIDAVDAVMRYVGYLINTPILLMGWIWALIDENNQGWHDKLANTYVVKVAPQERKRKNVDIGGGGC